MNSNEANTLKADSYQEIFKQTNKKINEILTRSIDLEKCVNRLEKDLKLSKNQHVIEIKVAISTYEDQMKKLKDMHEKASLNLELISNENQMLKDELLNLKLGRNNLESKFNETQHDVEKSNEATRSINVQIMSWKYKYKDLFEKLSDVEKLESKISKKVNSLVEENDNLKLINSHHCIEKDLLNEQNSDLSRKFEELMNKKKTENENLIREIQILNIDNEQLNESLNKSTERNKKLDSEIKNLNKQRLELQDQLNIAHQTISSNAQTLLEINNRNKNLENLSNEKDANIKSLEHENNLIRTELNNLKLSNDFLKNEVQSNKNIFETHLENEKNENQHLKSKVESLNEELYLAQLSVTELIDERRTLLAKKFCDNFTQTIFNLNSQTNKAVQTEKCTFLPSEQRQMFTQTTKTQTLDSTTQTVNFNLDEKTIRPSIPNTNPKNNVPKTFSNNNDSNSLAQTNTRNIANLRINNSSTTPGNSHNNDIQTYERYINSLKNADTNENTQAKNVPIIQAKSILKSNMVTHVRSTETLIRNKVQYKIPISSIDPFRSKNLQYDDDDSRDLNNYFSSHVTLISNPNRKNINTKFNSNQDLNLNPSERVESFGSVENIQLDNNKYSKRVRFSDKNLDLD